MKTVATIIFTILFTTQVFAQALTTHSNETHGFRLSYPSDWTVKESTTVGNVFKTVKNFKNDQYLTLTVSAQRLVQSGYSTADFKIEDVVNGMAGKYGQDVITPRSSGRSQVSGYPSIWFLADQHLPLPFWKPRVGYTVAVIKGRYLYIISSSCSKPLFAQYQKLIKQLVDSFVFDTSTNTATSHNTEHPNVLKKTGNAKN